MAEFRKNGLAVRLCQYIGKRAKLTASFYEVHGLTTHPDQCVSPVNFVMEEWGGARRGEAGGGV